MKKLQAVLTGLICWFACLPGWGQIIISEVFYDTPLEESMKVRNRVDLTGVHHNGEFIELYNNSPVSVDLSGYSLKSMDVPAYQTFVFPEHTVCDPNDYVIVAFRHPNSPEFKLKDLFDNISGDNERKILYHYCFVLSNKRNTVVLRNKDQEIISSMTCHQDDAHNGRHRSSLFSVNRLPALSNVYLNGNYGKIIRKEANPFDRCYDEIEIPLELALPTSQPTVADRSRTVGEVKMDVCTTLTGAADVTIPLLFPPGISGFAPEMSVNLNSQGGLGTLGVRGELTGLSAISREQQTNYFDGKSYPVKLQDGGPYSLDGVRLVQSRENPALYETVPVHSFTKIEAIGRSGNGPESFVVTESDGTVAEYGENWSGRVYAKDGVNILSWKLTKLTNPSGLCIYYRYTADPEMGSYIRSIYYQGLTETAIEFNYVPNDYLPSASYVDGTFLKAGLLLSSIAVNSTCYNTNRYGFEYSDARLTKVTEYGMSGEKLSMDIQWGEAGALTSDKEYKVEDKENGFGLMFGDINGDGLVEMVQTCPEEEYIGIYFQKSRGVYAEVPDCKITVNKPDIPSSSGNQNELKGFRAAELTQIMDIDHDGVDEFIFKRRGDLDRDGFYLYLLNVCKYDDGGFRVIRENQNMLGREAEMFPVDFGQDGYVDLLLVSKDGRFSYAQQRGESGNEGQIPMDNLDLILNLKKVVPFDRDGYGKISLLLPTYGSWSIYDLTEQRTLENVLPKDINMYNAAYAADMNNDGLSDLVFLDFTRRDKKIKFLILENKGGTFSVYSTFIIDGFEFPSDEDLLLDKILCLAGDMNGDGLSDQVLVLDFHYFNKDKIEKRTTHFLLKSADGSYRLDYQRMFNSEVGVDFADLNGDGALEMLKMKNNSISTDSYGGSEKYLFKSLWNNGVQKAVFEYGLASDHHVHQPYRHKAQESSRCALLSACLVKAMHVPNGLGDMQQADSRMTSRFKYYGGSYLNDGRGVLGFEKVEESYASCGNENKTITETNYDPATYMPAWQRVSKYINGRLSGISFCRNLIRPMGEVPEWGRARYALLPVEQCDSVFTDNSITCTAREYDQYNRMVSQTVSYDDGSYVKTDYDGFSPLWKPLRVVETRKHFQDSEPFVNDTRYVYDRFSNLTSQTDFVHTADPVTTVYTYDEFGRPLSKRTSGKNVELRTEAYAYSNSCDYVATTTNSTGETVSTYHSLSGNLKSQSLTYKGMSAAQTTTCGYDGLGRKLSEVRPDGSVWNKTYSWPENGAGYFATLESETGKPDLLKYYDVSGREIYSKTKDGDVMGEHAVIYNAVGQKLCEMSGHSRKLSSSVYSYYPEGRLKSITTSVGKEVRYSYNGRTTEVDENGRQFTKRLDSWGNVIEQTDPNGLKICHTYASCGKPKCTTVGSHVLKMEYDAKGNQLKLYDPNIGEIRYTYDAYGRIKTYQDPKGGYNLTYDLRGNISRKSYTQGWTVDYTYIYSGKGFGRVRTIRSSNGAEQSFTYDAFGRVLTKTEKLGNQLFAYSNTYDALGRLTSHTTPNGYVLNYAYDLSDSRLMRVLGGNNNDLWKRLEDVPGISSGYETGNGLICRTTRSKDESECSLRVLRNDTVAIHQHEYRLDPVRGNVVSRSEWVDGQWIPELFTYDEMDRLSSVEIQSETFISYDAQGNIIRKPNVGTYLYESARPHAVTDIDHPSGQLTFRGDQHIVYTQFNKIESIKEGTMEMRFTYGPDEERLKSELYSNGVLTRTIYYGEGFEREIDRDGKVTDRSFLDADGGIFGMAIKNPKGSTELYFFHTDLQGSVTGISSSFGSMVERHSYDAWGMRRNLTSSINLPPLKLSLRGYTFQEEMPPFGLINLNGRLYDPLLGRMLSPDPYIQEPGMTQSYNRYSYCLNNPLKYTDTNGEFWHLIVGAAIGGIINWTTHGSKFTWKGLGYFGIGAFSGALSAGIASGISGVMNVGVNATTTFGKEFISSSALLSATKGGFISGFTSGAGAGFAAGLVSGTGNGLLDGNSFGSSLGKGFVDGLIGGASGGITGGISAGISASLDGRDFWHGGRVTTDVKMDLKQMYQEEGSNDCRRVTCQSIDEHLNGDYVGIEELREKFPNVHTSEKELVDMYHSRKLAINEYIPKKDNLKTAEELADFLKRGKGLSYEMMLPNSTNGHATAVTRVRIYDNGRIRINLMNPYKGHIKVIRNFKKLHQFFWIQKL